MSHATEQEYFLQPQLPSEVQDDSWNFGKHEI